MNYCFVFVCQKGELEIKSMLLAASLRENLKGDFDYVVAVPKNSELSKTTKLLIKQLKLRVVEIENPIKGDYPIGNKIACLNIETQAKKIIFLDSDILCLKNFDPCDYFLSDFSAKPSDLSTFTNNDDTWKKVYDMFNLPLPQERVSTTVSEELILPYFNAGVIAIRNGIGFGGAWKEVCQTIDSDMSIENKYPWLDQIGLPVAAKKLGIGFNLLDENLNHPSHLKPLSDSVYLSHYHEPSVIRREPQLNALVLRLIKKYPLIKKLLSTSEDWSKLTKVYKIKRPFPFFTPKIKPGLNQPNIIITGLPRSGTSYLCSLIHTIKDSVVINEPKEIFSLLSNKKPWGMATYYQSLRMKILDRELIENKLKEGRVVEDTIDLDGRSEYQPTVSRQDFILSTKNTLAYLSHIPRLKRVMPDALIIACIRHPFDTIASWKTTFDHLKNASVESFPVGGLEDDILDEWQKEELNKIGREKKMSVKRALLWNYLAKILLKCKDRLFVIKYEDLVQNPMEHLEAILEAKRVLSHQLVGTINPSTAKHERRQFLDEEDLVAMKRICSNTAKEFGYFFD